MRFFTLELFLYFLQMHHYHDLNYYYNRVPNRIRMMINRPWRVARERERERRVWKMSESNSTIPKKHRKNFCFKVARIRIGFSVSMSGGFQGSRVVSWTLSPRGGKEGGRALLSMPVSRKTRQLISVNYFLFTSASARVSLTRGSSVSARNEKLFLRSFRLREF